MNYLLFITDGSATVRAEDVIPAAIALRVRGVKLIVVGLGDIPNKMEITR